MKLSSSLRNTSLLPHEPNSTPYGITSLKFRAVKKSLDAKGQNLDVETQVFGVDWNTGNNIFSTEHVVITDKVTMWPTTIRNLLKVAATFNYPLGLTSPVSIIGKCIFYDTFCR
jgi:hypothetical protein